MIRRSRMDTMLGRPIVKLPDMEMKTIDVRFDPVERSLYDLVKQRYMDDINNLQDKENVDRKLQKILEMLMRLRQMTSHLFM